MAEQRHDVVFGLSSETWDDMVRREFARPPDRMVQHLLASGRVGRLVVVNPWRSIASQVKRRAGRRRDAPFPGSASAHLLRPVRLRRGDSPDVEQLRRSYCRYNDVIRFGTRRRSLRDPIFITFNPLHAAFGSHTGFRSVTYVGRDDWTAYHGTPELHPAYERAYELIRERGIRVCAVSDELLARIAPTATARCVPNGVDPTVWSEPLPEPEAVRSLPRPIALYTGTVDERLSLDAVTSLAAAVADGTVLLIGPRNEADAAAVARVRGNVVMMDSMRQSALAAYVAAADVCVLPHVDSRLTRAMSPLKVYEYLAAGRPVAAIDLPPVRGIDPSIVLAPDAAGFGAAALKAIAAGPLTDQRRRAFIAANSWDARCATILDVALS